MWNNVAQAYSPEPVIRNEDAATTVETQRTNWAIRMASAGFYKDFAEDAAAGGGDYTRRNVGNLAAADGTADATLSVLLNNAPASYPGALFRFRAGQYNYMCTRNHNFSNRDQKAHLQVSQAIDAAQA
jgi:hypothetical protein